MNTEQINNEALKCIDDMIEDEDGKKVVLSRKWIEQEAASFLIDNLNKYNGIFDATGITTKDKGISYDGRVEVLNNAGEGAKDFLGFFDVQVKGTLVDEIKKGNSKFQIEVKHLKNYVKNPLGVLLFVIQIKKGTLEKKIFFRYLLPVDLKKIFETIKDEQDDKTLDIYPIDSNQKSALKKICLNFLKAQKKQAGKRIVMLDDNMLPLKIEIQDFRINKNELLKDKIYLYACLNKEEGFIPIELPKDAKIGAVTVIEKPIIINGKKYYDNYKSIIGEQEVIYQFGENVRYNLETKTLNFKFKGTILEQINDMEFALEIMQREKKDSYIEKYNKLRNTLEIIKKFNLNLKKLNINVNNEFNVFSTKDYNSMLILDDLLSNSETVLNKIKLTGIYTIDIQDKSIILFIEKNGEKITVYNFFDNFSSKFCIAEFVNEKYVRVCPYVLLNDSYKFSNILNFDYESVFNSLELSDNRDELIEGMNEMLLSFISSYDDTNNEDFYKLAEIIIKILADACPDCNIILINKFQLIKRKRDYTEKELKKIYDMREKETEPSILYAISILLDNETDISYYYNMMTEEQREELNGKPIEFLKK